MPPPFSSTVQLTLKGDPQYRDCRLAAALLTGPHRYYAGEGPRDTHPQKKKCLLPFRT